MVIVAWENIEVENFEIFGMYFQICPWLSYTMFLHYLHLFHLQAEQDTL